MNPAKAIVLPMQGFRIPMSDGFTAQVWSTRDVAGRQLLSPGQQIDTRVVSSVFSLEVGSAFTVHGTGRSFRRFSCNRFFDSS